MYVNLLQHRAHRNHKFHITGPEAHTDTTLVGNVPIRFIKQLVASFPLIYEQFNKVSYLFTYIIYLKSVVPSPGSKSTAPSGCWGGVTTRRNCKGLGLNLIAYVLTQPLKQKIQAGPLKVHGRDQFIRAIFFQDKILHTFARQTVQRAFWRLRLGS